MVLGFMRWVIILKKEVKPWIRFLSMTVGCLMAISGFVLSAVEADKVNQKTNAGDLPHSIASYLREKYPEGGNILNRMRDGGGDRQCRLCLDGPAGETDVAEIEITKTGV